LYLYLLKISQSVRNQWIVQYTQVTVDIVFNNHLSVFLVTYSSVE